MTKKMVYGTQEWSCQVPWEGSVLRAVAGRNRAQRYREMKRQSGVVNPRRRKSRKYKVTATAINFAFKDMFRMITIISPK